MASPIFPSNQNNYGIAIGSTNGSGPGATHFDVRAPTSYDTNFPLGQNWIWVGNSAYTLVGQTNIGGIIQSIWANDASSLSAGQVVLGGPASILGVPGSGVGTATLISSANVTYVPKFTELPVMSATTGGTAAVTINTTNAWAIPQWGAYFEQYNTTVSTNIAPLMSATAGFGLNINNINGAASKSIEITEGNSANTKNGFTIGTSLPFYVQASFNINTLADVTSLYVGFRKQQAYQATLPAGYTDYAVIGVNGTAGLIESQTQLATGGNVLTTSGISAVAGTTFTLRVNVSTAGVVQYLINGVVAVTAAYTFAAAGFVIPYIIYSTSAGGNAEVDLVSYVCGFQ